MKILFVTTNPYLPEDYYGGKQFSIHSLCRELIIDGDNVVVLSGFSKNRLFSKYRLKSLIRSRLFNRPALVDDFDMGYKVYRTWVPLAHINRVLDIERPDVLVAFSGDICNILRTAKEVTKAPLVASWASVSNFDNFSAVEFPDLLHVANSEFVARELLLKFNARVVTIPPIIDSPMYKVGRSDASAKFVTFVNPVAFKGVDRALNIAKACNDIPFIFQWGWSVSQKERRELEDAVRGIPNIMLRPNTRDMRSVYKLTRILLVPNRGPEAWGRVITESQLSGIPAVASAIGGLPESVGEGGILIDPNADDDEWVDKVRSLYFNDRMYGDLSQLAQSHSSRYELSATFLAKKLRNAIAEYTHVNS